MTNDALDESNEFVVVATYDGRIQSLDARDGQARWTRTLGHGFAGLALAQVGDEVVALSGDGYVCKLALDDGALRWDISLPIGEPVTTPIGGTRIVANQRLAAVQLGPIIFALALDDGHLIWEARSGIFTHQWWLLAAGEEHIYTLQKERPHQGAEGATRQPDAPPPGFAFVTTAFSTWDGTPHWFAKDEDSAFEPPWDGGSSLVEGDGVVYLYNVQGLRAFAASNGERLWSSDSTPPYHLGALALSSDAIMVASGAHFGTYRRDAGTPLWSQTIAKRADGHVEEFSTPLALGDAVCVGRSSIGGAGPYGFHIESRDKETGALRWVWPTSDEVVPVDVSWRYRGTGATLYVPMREALRAIQAADGRERWRLNYDFSSGPGALLAVSMATA